MTQTTAAQACHRVDGESSTASSLNSRFGVFSAGRWSCSKYSLSSSMVNPMVPLASLKCTLQMHMLKLSAQPSPSHCGSGCMTLPTGASDVLACQLPWACMHPACMLVRKATAGEGKSGAQASADVGVLVLAQHQAALAEALAANLAGPHINCL